MTGTVDDISMRLFEPFWTNLVDRRLSFPRCERCERFHWYPKQKCPHCGSERIAWQLVGPTARLYSWTVVRHAFAPEYQDKLPYVVGLVVPDGARGVRLITNVVGIDPDALTFDLPVVADLGSAEPEQHRVTFSPATGMAPGPDDAEIAHDHV